MKGFVNLTHTNNGRIKLTEEDILSFVNGSKIVKKTQEDEDGVNIKSNYAKKEDINSLILDASYNNTNGHFTISLKDKDNNVITSTLVDLPIEQIITNGVYNKATQKIELTLATGQIIEIFVGDLIDTYSADEITISLTNGRFSLSGSYKSKIDNNSSNIVSLQNAVSTINTNINSLSETKENKKLVYKDISILETDWVANTTTFGMNYKCDVALNGISENDVVFVMFNEEDAQSGNFANTCNSGTNIVTIYAKEKQKTVIPAIVVFVGGSL